MATACPCLPLAVRVASMFHQGYFVSLGLGGSDAEQNQQQVDLPVRKKKPLVPKAAGTGSFVADGFQG